MKPRHLYVHVPFCGRRCVYCDFSIAVRRVVPVREFVNSLAAELAGISAAFSDAGDDSSPWVLETIYLGGGTPSRLGPDGVQAVLDLICRHASVVADAEITIEANPEDVTPEAVAGWRQAGVNRVSLGAQSFDDKVLGWMHRSHTGEDVRKSVAILSDGGISNFSIDLIFALPASLSRSWTRDLDQAIELSPTHISIYGLTVEPATPLARWVSSGRVHGGDEDSYAAEFLEADSRLGSAGYTHYEISNYARDGMTSRHNSAYWSGVDYLGIGPSAHSLMRNERRWNVRAYEAWKTRVLSGAPVVEGSEMLTPDARLVERIYLGLRTNRGLRDSGIGCGEEQRWMEAGWMTRTDDAIRLTPQGWLRLDSIAADLAGTHSGDNYISNHGSTAA